jgi:hypothetical protein
MKDSMCTNIRKGYETKQCKKTSSDIPPWKGKGMINEPPRAAHCTRPHREWIQNTAQTEKEKENLGPIGPVADKNRRSCVLVALTLLPPVGLGIFIIRYLTFSPPIKRKLVFDNLLFMHTISNFTLEHRFFSRSWFWDCIHKHYSHEASCAERFSKQTNKNKKVYDTNSPVLFSLRYSLWSVFCACLN